MEPQEIVVHDVSETIVRYIEHLNASLADPRAPSTGNPNVPCAKSALPPSSFRWSHAVGSAGDEKHDGFGSLSLFVAGVGPNQDRSRVVDGVAVNPSSHWRKPFQPFACKALKVVCDVLFSSTAAFLAKDLQTLL